MTADHNDTQQRDSPEDVPVGSQLHDELMQGTERPPAGVRATIDTSAPAREDGFRRVRVDFLTANDRLLMTTGAVVHEDAVDAATRDLQSHCAALGIPVEVKR